MFGTDPHGAPYARQLLLRTNPERRRPGPVIIHVNPQLLRAADIAVSLDGRAVTTPSEFLSLIEAIEANGLVRRESPPPAKRLVIANRESSSSISFAPRQSMVRGFAPALPDTQNVRVETLITARGLERDFIVSLRKRRVERKFGLIGDVGTQTWLALCASPGYAAFHHSLKLIQDWGGEICDNVGAPANEIAFWPGNGRKEASLAKTFHERGGVTYHFVDTSIEMIRESLVTAEEVPAPKYGYVADFLRFGTVSAVCQRARNSGIPRSLLIFLGNSFSTISPGEFIRAAWEGMVQGDFALFDVLCERPRHPPWPRCGGR